MTLHQPEVGHAFSRGKLSLDPGTLAVAGGTGSWEGRQENKKCQRDRASVPLAFLLNFRIRKNIGASLVAQWLGVCLLMQGTRVRALVWEDPTRRGAAGPVSHNC
ncbi:hypothetical protein J1605_015526 [Eschrichtius robustus]|uniref:Uncharacterized protein n=1 Tax=Eschrichtius robustus TaxID=9764 RepID=A0AB34G9G1_ESCRO|nr:hypothetical protein J1605_015526 [Eschrichtius robustus]